MALTRPYLPSLTSPALRGPHLPISVLTGPNLPPRAHTCTHPTSPLSQAHTCPHLPIPILSGPHLTFTYPHLPSPAHTCLHWPSFTLTCPYLPSLALISPHLPQVTPRLCPRRSLRAWPASCRGAISPAAFPLFWGQRGRGAAE